MAVQGEVGGDLGAGVAAADHDDTLFEAQCSELREEINRLESELEQAERERDYALDRCAELELQLASVEEGAEREELEEELQEARREVADAANNTQDRLTELQQAVQQAENLRDQATRDAQAKLEEADAVFEETRAKAAQAAADFETNLAKRRAQSERDLTARQQKAEKRLAEIEHRAEQLRLEAEKLRTDAERRARQTIEAAERQAAELNSASASTTGQVPMAQEAPSLPADAAFKPFWFAVPEPRPLRPLDGQPTEEKGMMLKPMTWYLAIGSSGNTLITEDRTTGIRGLLDDTSKLQRAQY
ncbi:hypothetical protein [Streptomyces sp. NPDC003273]|uniref:hypothetical protein n=1 Tax=Streptomyces sp. NPDC003273 TaxID=3364678 RepID=UPI0036B21C06